MNITEERLIQSGYKKFHDTIEAMKMGDWYRASYQKRITDQYGTRYFITIRHSVMPPRDFEKKGHDFFTPHNQFRDNNTTFEIKMLCENETIEEIEEFFAKLWNKMHLNYYEELTDDKG